MYVNPPQNSCVDQQLLEFHGRVSFRQYISTKLGKFGMKIFWLTNSEGTYVYNGIPYIGGNTIPEDALRSASNYSEALVLQLTKPFYGSGTHLTGDNYFSSSSLVDKLAEKNISYIGTVNVNRVDVPPEAKLTIGRTKGDSKFYYSQNQFICSFWDKKKTPVLLLDSFAKVGIHEEANSKPDTVLLYNKNKSGVDNIDKLLRVMPMKRKCRRWPYGFVMNLLNIAVLNSIYVLKNTREIERTQINHQHFNFLISAGMQLIDIHIHQRANSAAANQPNVKAALQIIGIIPKLYNPIKKQLK